MDYYSERIKERKEPIPQPGELPESYNEDILVFMVRDPYWIFAYWNIKSETFKRLETQIGSVALGQARTIIKIYKGNHKEDLQNAVLHMEMDVSGPARSWYIHLGQPDKYFYGVLGCLTPSGEFIEIARSNPIQLPRDTIASQQDQKWMTSEETYERLLSITREEGTSPTEWGLRKKEVQQRLFEAPGSFPPILPPEIHGGR